MADNYSLSDLAAVTDRDGFGGNNAWVMLILFALIFGGGGFGGYSRGGEQLATSADVQRGFDTNSLEQQIRGISNGLADLGYALDNKIEGAKDFVTAGIGNVKDAVVAEGRGLQGQLSEHNCTTQRNIDSVRFDMANYHADTNAVTVAQTQKILDALAQNKIDALQAQVSELKTQNMFCGIPRINPYGYGVYPYANACGCACNANTSI